MGRSVQISTEIPPPLSLIEHLGISKARQKELKAMMKETIEAVKREKAAKHRLAASEEPNRAGSFGYILDVPAEEIEAIEDVIEKHLHGSSEAVVTRMLHTEMSKSISIEVQRKLKIAAGH